MSENVPLSSSIIRSYAHKIRVIDYVRCFCAHSRLPEIKHGQESLRILDLQEAWNSQSRKERPGSQAAQLREEVDARGLEFQTRSGSRYEDESLCKLAKKQQEMYNKLRKSTSRAAGKNRIDSYLRQKIPGCRRGVNQDEPSSNQLLSPVSKPVKLGASTNGSPRIMSQKRNSPLPGVFSRPNTSNESPSRILISPLKRRPIARRVSWSSSPRLSYSWSPRQRKNIYTFGVRAGEKRLPHIDRKELASTTPADQCNDRRSINKKREHFKSPTFGKRMSIYKRHKRLDVINKETGTLLQAALNERDGAKIKVDTLQRTLTDAENEKQSLAEECATLRRKNQALEEALKGNSEKGDDPENKSELCLTNVIGQTQRGRGGAPPISEKIVYLRMLVAGAPPSGLSQMIHSVLNSQNTPAVYPLPTRWSHAHSRRVLYPLNIIFAALQIGVSTNVGVNVDGKSFNSWEVLACYFTCSTALGVSRFNGGALTVVDSTAIGGAVTFAQLFRRMGSYHSKFREMLSASGLNPDDPRSYWKPEFLSLGVPGTPSLRQVTALASDSCNTMLKEYAEINKKRNEAMELEGEGLSSGETHEAVGVSDGDEMEEVGAAQDRIIDEALSEAFAIGDQENRNGVSKGANTNSEINSNEDSSTHGTNGIVRMGCSEHNINNATDKGIKGVVEKHIELMEEKADRPLNSEEKKQSDPLLLFRQTNLLLESKAGYYLNIFTKHVLPWLNKNHADEPWLSYPRGVGSRFWVIILASISFMFNLIRMVSFLGYRRECGHFNKIESNVWHGATNEDVVHACLVIALICDQVVIPCLLAISGKVVDIKEMGAFCDGLESTLNNPVSILNRECKLEKVNENLAAAVEKRRDRGYVIISHRGRNNGTKKKIDYTALLAFEDEDKRMRAIILVKAFCAAMLPDFQEKMAPFLTSQNGDFREGKPIPQILNEMGSTNTAAERQLSKNTYVFNKLQNANMEAISGQSSFELNRYLEQTSVLPRKEEEKTKKERAENFSIGLADKLNPQFLAICVNLAYDEVQAEVESRRKNQQSQTNRAEENMNEEKKKRDRVDRKKAHEEAMANCLIADGSLVKSIELLEAKFKMLCDENQKKSEIDATHTYCKTQIALFARGLNYPEAQKIKFTKNKIKLDLRGRLRELVALGVHRNFECLDGNAKEDEGSCLPGKKTDQALELERLRKDKIDEFMRFAEYSAKEELENQAMAAADKESKAAEREAIQQQKEKQKKERAAQQEAKKKASALSKDQKKKRKKRKKNNSDGSQKDGHINVPVRSGVSGRPVTTWRNKSNQG